MKITVKNFRGARSAAISDAGISLVAGRNHAGKTSVLLATACALSGNMTPLGLRKADAGALVMTGASGAVVEIESDGSTTRGEWPKAERSTTGDNPPTASEVAAGLVSVVKMKPDERTLYFGELLKTDPTRDDFNAAAIEAGIVTAETVSKLDKIWETVSRDGWAAAHTNAQAAGRERKGAWEQVTKEKYGEKKAESWEPKDWSAELASESQQSLEDAVTAARAETEHFVGKFAIGQEEFERLQMQAEKFEERKATWEAAKSRLNDLRSTLSDIEREIATIGETRDGGIPCPHCGGKIKLVRVSSAETKLEKAPEPDPDKLHEYRSTLSAAEGRKAHCIQGIKAAEVESDRAYADFAASEEARSRLDEGATAAEDTSEELNKARERERRAERSLEAFKAKMEADRIHRSIKTNALIIEILSPAGVRHTVLTRCLRDFNARLAEISSLAQWGTVSVTESLGVELNGRAYALLSKSEQFRCRVALQVAAAEIDGSCAVVIDGADILDNPSRGGLIAMLAKRKLRAIVGMTLRSRDAAPDLKGKGVGDVYWIENGEFSANERQAA